MTRDKTGNADTEAIPPGLVIADTGLAEALNFYDGQYLQTVHGVAGDWAICRHKKKTKMFKILRSASDADIQNQIHGVDIKEVRKAEEMLLKKRQE